MSTIEVGELLYEYTVKFTGMTEYGVSLESLMAGREETVEASTRATTTGKPLRPRESW